MKKLVVLSILLGISLLVVACGPADTEGPLDEVPGDFAETPGALDETPPAVLATEAATAETPAFPAPTTPQPTDTTATQAAGTPGIPQTGGEMAPPSHLSALLDYTVVNMQGDIVGQVEDSVIDVSSEVVLYIVVSLDNETDRLVAIPYYRLDISTGTDENIQEIALKFDDNLLENAPDFDLAMLDFSDDSWNTAIETYWESPEATPTPEEPAETEEAEETPAAAEEATPEAPAATTTPAGFVMATNLLEADVSEQVQGEAGDAAAVVNPIGEPVGILAEVIIDPVSGRLQYFVVQAALAGSAESWIPVPLFRVLVLRDIDDILAEDVTIVLDSEQLAAAPSFEINALPDTPS